MVYGYIICLLQFPCLQQFPPLTVYIADADYNTASTRFQVSFRRSIEKLSHLKDAPQPLRQRICVLDHACRLAVVLI